MSDNILSRLSNQPPYVDDKGQVTEVQNEDQTNDQQIDETVQENAQEERENPTVETSNERTREQFQKLTQSNQNLNEENEKLKQELEAKKAEARRLASEGLTSVMTPEFVPPQPPQPNYWDNMTVNKAPDASQFQGMSQKQVNDVFKSLVDDEGYVNTDLLKEEMAKQQRITQAALAEAQRARQEAQMSRKTFDDFQRNQIAKSVHDKHKDLNPDNTELFNPDYYDAVKNELFGQMMRGEAEDYMKAADKWASKFKKEPMVNKQADAAAQINATNPGTSRRVQSTQADMDKLRKDMWQNKKGSITERLRRSGYHE